MHSENTRSLFGLQRLMATLSKIDTSPEMLEQELLIRSAPVASKALALTDEAIHPTEEVGQ